MARMTPPQRREAILAAAVEVMVRKGIAGTTVRDVADRMRSSPGLVHHYFTSMDELLAAAFERAAGQDLQVTREAMDRAPGPVQRLAVFYDCYARSDQDWAFQLWLDAWAEAARRPVVQATSRRLNVAWQQLLAGTIRDGVRAGAMICTDPDGAGWRILSLLDGLALQVVAHRVAIDRADVVRWSLAFAETELHLAPGTLRDTAVRDRRPTAPGPWIPPAVGGTGRAGRSGG